MNQERPVCCYCSKPDNFPADPDSELRPYGPKGAWLCFGCMQSSPEREEEAHRQLGQQLNAAGPVAIIGEPTGPRPFEGGKDG